MVSRDGGKTWTRSMIADGNPNNPVGNMLQAYSDPGLAFDEFGNLFLTYNALPPSWQWQAALYVSADNGQTFQAVVGFDGSMHHDLPRVAVGPSGLTGSGEAQSAVWVSRYRQDGICVSGAPIRGLGAANVGPNWTTTIMPNTAAFFQVSSVTVGPNGAVLLAYVDGTSSVPPPPPRTIYTALDQDGLGTLHGFVQHTGTFQSNVSFDTEIDANPNAGANPIIHVDWDRQRNRAYLVYPDRLNTNPTNQDLDIYVRFSTDGGATWSSPRRVNDDPPSNGKTQFHPRLAVDQHSGNVAVAWYDCRHDPLNRRVYFYAAVSRDGFASMTPPKNFRLNPVSSLATTASFAHYYDYSGLAFMAAGSTRSGAIFPPEPATTRMGPANLTSPYVRSRGNLRAFEAARRPDARVYIPMKSPLVLVALLVSGLEVHAQGTILFLNRLSMPYVESPIYAPDGVTLAPAGSVYVQLHAGFEANSLEPVSPPVLIGPKDGYYRGGEISFPNAAPGSWLWFQVVAWDVRAGGLEEARAQGLLWGQSNLFADQLSGPPPYPSLPLFGLRPMTLVPEPSAGVLLVLGGAGLLALARRRRVGSRRDGG